MVKKWREIGIGIGLTVATIVFVQFLSTEQTHEFYAMILILIGAAYIGFALADGRLQQIAIEAIGVIGFSLCAFVGLWFFPLAIPIGYFAHGIWDMVHHPHGIKTNVTDLYIPFCLAYDWLMAAYIAYWLYHRNSFFEIPM